MPVKNVDLLILDEPFQGFDHSAGNAIAVVA